MFLRKNGYTFDLDVCAHWQLLDGNATYALISLYIVAVKQPHTHVRHGLVSPQYLVYTSFIAWKFFMSSMNTLTYQ